MENIYSVWYKYCVSSTVWNPGCLRLCTKCRSFYVVNCWGFQWLNVRIQPSVKPDPPERVTATPIRHNARRLEVSWQSPATWPDIDNFPLKYFLRYRPLIREQWQHVSSSVVCVCVYVCVRKWRVYPILRFSFEVMIQHIKLRWKLNTWTLITIC